MKAHWLWVMIFCRMGLIRLTKIFDRPINDICQANGPKMYRSIWIGNLGYKDNIGVIKSLRKVTIHHYSIKHIEYLTANVILGFLKELCMEPIWSWGFETTHVLQSINTFFHSDMSGESFTFISSDHLRNELQQW